MAIHIFIDADACPVKEETMRVATRYGLRVTLVSNQGMRPIRAPHVQQITVSAKFDAADDWIVEHIFDGDIIITNDIPLAARCLQKEAMALNSYGREFTNANIGQALSMRELSAHLRETGDIKGNNPSFSKNDRSEFLQSLDRLIQRI